MTTPKDAEAIVEAFNGMGEFYVLPHKMFRRVTGITAEGEAFEGMAFDINSYVRSALASYTMHLKGEIKKQKIVCRARRPVDEIHHPDLCECLELEEANKAIAEVHALLDEKIRKLTV